MTKFGTAALAGVALAAATLATPALASAAPASQDGLIAVTFDATEHNNFLGFRQITFACADINKGDHPYIVKDDPSRSNFTYFTGDGNYIGHYFGDIGVLSLSDAGGPLTRIVTTLSHEHKTVTFYCAKTEQAANHKA